MRKQVLVIGLGQFGMSLVRSLAALDVDVIAVDRSEERAREAASSAASVSCADATNEAQLADLVPAQRDVCICAIGDESRESSIICTALLRQQGARLVLARATDELHARILSLIGAHEIINPESVVGKRVALRVAHEGLLDELPFGEDLVLTELETPPAFSGRNLADLKLPATHQVMVVAIRRDDEVLLPRADSVLQSGDLMVLVSRPGAAGKLLQKVR